MISRSSAGSSAASWAGCSAPASPAGRQSGGGSGQSLPDGTYNVTATAMDIAGTVSASSPAMTIVIDTQPPPAPRVTGISPNTGRSNDGITTAHNLTICGTAQAGNLVVVLIERTSRWAPPWPGATAPGRSITRR